jgi:endonuclease YncB( thermonuclease family)
VRSLTLLLLAFSCSPAGAQSLRVHDGDTFTLDGQRWRLWGVDAPELKQTCQQDGIDVPCGVWAQGNLVKLTAGHAIYCTPVGKSYDRLVGKCTADGVDLSAAQVRDGWALDYRTYSHGAYAGEEAQAKARHAGVWSMESVAPWEWRREQKRGLSRRR